MAEGLERTENMGLYCLGEGLHGLRGVWAVGVYLRVGSVKAFTYLLER